MLKKKAAHKIKLMKYDSEQISETRLPACLRSFGRKRFSLIISRLWKTMTTLLETLQFLSFSLTQKLFLPLGPLKPLLVTILWQWLCNLPILALEWGKKGGLLASSQGLERPFLSQLARSAGSLRRLSTGCLARVKEEGRRRLNS